MTSQSLTFKVGLIGPTRVGKTTLVTSLLTDGQRLLQQSPVHLTAADTPTRIATSSTAAFSRGNSTREG